MSVSAEWSKPTIVGELVTLRPMVAADFDAVWEMIHDPEGNDLTATEATFTPEQIREWTASRAEQDERLDLAIVENATGDFAGEVVLNEYDAATRSANFRIALRGPAWYGRRLGGEATTMIVDHGFEVVGLRSVTLGVLARNTRARRAYERSGFRTTSEHTEDGERWIEMTITPEDRPAGTPDDRLAGTPEDRLAGRIRRQDNGPHE